MHDPPLHSSRYSTCHSCKASGWTRSNLHTHTSNYAPSPVIVVRYVAHCSCGSDEYCCSWTARLESSCLNGRMSLSTVLCLPYCICPLFWDRRTLETFRFLYDDTTKQNLLLCIVELQCVPRSYLRRALWAELWKSEFTLSSKQLQTVSFLYEEGCTYMSHGVGNTISII